MLDMQDKKTQDYLIMYCIARVPNILHHISIMMRLYI